MLFVICSIRSTDIYISVERENIFKEWYFKEINHFPWAFEVEEKLPNFPPSRKVNQSSWGYLMPPQNLNKLNEWNFSVVHSTWPSCHSYQSECPLLPCKLQFSKAKEVQVKSATMKSSSQVLFWLFLIKFWNVPDINLFWPVYFQNYFFHAKNVAQKFFLI